MSVFVPLISLRALQGYALLRQHILRYRSRCICHVEYFIKWVPYAIIMKPIAEIEEKLASKAEPILGFKPSSKIKRGPIGILISIICIVIVYRELSRAGVI